MREAGVFFSSYKYRITHPILIFILDYIFNSCHRELYFCSNTFLEGHKVKLCTLLQHNISAFSFNVHNYTNYTYTTISLSPIKKLLYITFWLFMYREFIICRDLLTGTFLQIIIYENIVFNYFILFPSVFFRHWIPFRLRKIQQLYFHYQSIWLHILWSQKSI